MWKYHCIISMYLGGMYLANVSWILGDDVGDSPVPLARSICDMRGSMSLGSPFLLCLFFSTKKWLKTAISRG